VALAELIKAGFLTPNIRLYRTYLKTELEATLLPTGEVEFQGTKYRGCGPAAEAAARTVKKEEVKFDGWTFWRYRDGDGQPRVLDEARKRFLQATRAT
jgi:streptomycin 6-kinase